MKKIESITYKQLKQFLDSLPENELEKQVIISGEEEGYYLTSVDTCKEDYVQTDYGIEPASVQEYEPDEEPWPVTWEKGTPVLYVL